MQALQIPSIKTTLLSQALEVFGQSSIPMPATKDAAAWKLWNETILSELKKQAEGVSVNVLRHAVVRGLLLYDYAMRNREAMMAMGHMSGELPNVRFLPSLVAAGARARATLEGLDEGDMHYILEEIAKASQQMAQVGK